MALIYHITSAQAWQAAQVSGAYRADSLDREGFIHASMRDQVMATANRYYRGLTDLVLLEIDEEVVKPEVRYEIATVGETFPHIYGPLNLDAVVRVVPFDPDSTYNFA
jgi:uncharacterized protein (DUF952 family)